MPATVAVSMLEKDMSESLGFLGGALKKRITFASEEYDGYLVEDSMEHTLGLPGYAEGGSARILLNARPFTGAKPGDDARDVFTVDDVKWQIINRQLSPEGSFMIFTVQRSKRL